MIEKQKILREIILITARDLYKKGEVIIISNAIHINYNFYKSAKIKSKDNLFIEIKRKNNTWDSLMIETELKRLDLFNDNKLDSHFKLYKLTY